MKNFITLLVLAGSLLSSTSIVLAQQWQGIEVANNKIFCLPANANNAEGAVTDGASTYHNHVTITFNGYWTTWSDVNYYGDFDCILAVGVNNPATITFTADEGYYVTLESLQILGSDEGGGNLSLISAGSKTWTDIAAPELDGSSNPTHTDLIVNETAASVVLTFRNDDGNYGWDGINNILFSSAPIDTGTIFFIQ